MSVSFSDDITIYIIERYDHLDVEYDRIITIDLNNILALIVVTSD
jgi:predicted secreted Zn-dependent protease